MPDWLLPLVAAVYTIATPFLAWWGSSRYFTGQFEQWRINSEEWRQRTDRRLETIDATIQTSSAFAVRVSRAEQDIVDLREWKHLVVDPHIGDIKNLNQRMNRLESK